MLAVYYMYSILIYMIIDFGIANMFSYKLWNRMNELLYAAGENIEDYMFKNISPFNYFIMFAVPVIRLVMTITLIYLATCSEESFDELLDAMKNARQ